jgi:exosortase/archaeosortase family protein
MNPIHFFIRNVKSFVDKNRQMIFFVSRIVLIYLSWKLLSWFLGEEKIPIEERIWPWLSAGWEQFNDWIRIFLLYSSKLVFDAMGYSNEVLFQYKLMVPQLAYVEVGNYCLGIQLWIFFAALICSYPGAWFRKLWFSFVGILVINILNIIRIVTIVFAVHAYPKQMQFNHDYIFNVAVYIFTLLMWIYIVKNNKLEPKQKIRNRQNNR